MEVDLDPDHENGRGGIHGGMVATLVDVSAGWLVGRHVEPGTPHSTRDLTVHYLASIDKGPAWAVVRIRHRSRQTFVIQVDVVDRGDGDRLCAVSTVTYAVQAARPAADPSAR